MRVLFNGIWISIFLCTKVFSATGLEKLAQRVEEISQNKSSLPLSNLPIFEKLPQSLSPLLKEKFSGLTLSKLALQTNEQNLLIFRGETPLDGYQFLIEIRAFGEAQKSIKRANNLAPLVNDNSELKKIIARFPDNDSLSMDPVGPVNKFPKKVEIHQIVGDLRPVPPQSAAKIAKIGAEERAYLNRFGEQQQYLSLAPSYPVYPSQKDDEKIYDSVNYSFMIVMLPSFFSHLCEKVDVRLARSMNLLNFEQVVLVYSTAPYYHSELKRDIWPGLNIMGSVKINAINQEPLASSIKLINNYTELSELEYLDIYGLISPQIIGSILNIDLPGTMKIGKKVTTKALQLRLEVVDHSIPLDVSVKTGLTIAMPRQAPLELLGSLNFSPPSLFSLAAELPGIWKNPFGVPGVELEDVAMEIGTDFEVVAASEGTIPITDLGGRASIKMDLGEIDLAFFISLSEDERILIYGNFLGELSLKKLVDLSLKMYVHDTSKSKAIISSKMKENMKASIPDLYLREAQVYISPAHQIIAHKEYHKGMSLKAKIDIWDDSINFETKVGPKGLYTLAYIPAFHIGPLTVRGPKFLSDTNNIYELASVSKINSSSGPIIYLNVDPAQTQAEFFIDALIEANILSGISADTRIYFAADGAKFSLKEKIGNAFEAELNFSTDNHEKSRDLSLDGRFEKQGLHLLEYKLRALKLREDNSILSRVFSYMEDIFDFTKIVFNADFDGMKENKLVLDIEFSLLKKDFSIKNVVLDFDNLEQSLQQIASKIAKKIANHGFKNLE